MLFYKLPLLVAPIEFLFPLLKTSVASAVLLTAIVRDCHFKLLYIFLFTAEIALN